VPVIGQLSICWDTDRDAAAPGPRPIPLVWRRLVNANLPSTAGFDGATQFVGPEDGAQRIPCGQGLDALVDAVRAYLGGERHRMRRVQIGDTARTGSSTRKLSRRCAALTTAADGK
jgi:hypothetical protein